MGRIFQVLTPSPQRQILGNYILNASESGDTYNGMVAALNNNSGTPQWIKADGTDDAVGLFYEHMDILEESYDLLDLADENLITVMEGLRVGVITGQFQALLSVDYFDAAPDPAVELYDAEDGSITTTGSGKEKIGRCLGTQTSGSTTLYHCWFDFGSIHAVG
jgi:hypothetical protein